LDLNYLQSDIKAIIADTQCLKEKDVSGEKFVCKATSPACTFTWPLDPILGLGAKGIAIIAGRTDVVSLNFSKGGYAWYGPPKVGDDSDPKIGVAIVECDQNSVFRSAFIFSHGADIKNYGSLFRTRGYDWMSRAHSEPPYLPEIFSMAALHGISGLIWNDRSNDELRANDKTVLLDKEDIKTVQVLRQDELTVGNNSDFGLGTSRGACALAMLAAGVKLTTVHIAPSEVIEDYHSLTPSAVITKPDGTLKSVPCTLITTWLSQSATPTNALPSAYVSSRMKYPARDGFNGKEGVWQAYAARTGGVMLHMFGYQVAKPDNDVLAGAKGQWPRPELLK
ncbi:MAG: hypothetical protein Q8L22_06535, partial [Reyranella sp.]|nr:hypothetical protein [Reyranella sp.]